MQHCAGAGAQRQHRRVSGLRSLRAGPGWVVAVGVLLNHDGTRGGFNVGLFVEGLPVASVILNQIIWAGVRAVGPLDTGT